MVYLAAYFVTIKRGVKDIREFTLLATDIRERNGIVLKKLVSRRENLYEKRKLLIHLLIISPSTYLYN